MPCDVKQQNASTIYRTLRRMEADGVSQSAWETGGPGPKRRDAVDTALGTEHLAEWIAVLESRRARIDWILSAYHNLQTTGASDEHGKSISGASPRREIQKTGTSDRRGTQL